VHAVTVIPFPGPSDAAARDRIRYSLAESLIVEAAAGTGKTTELVARIKQVLAEGLTTVDRIVAVTFTHKAAGELKIRLRQKLDQDRTGATDEVRDRLEQALEQLEEASIGTIHGFCAQILRSRPVEARVDPAFEELTEQEASRLYDRAFRNWFAQQLDRDSPGLRRALARLAWRDSWESGPALDQLKYAGRNLIEWRDFSAPWSRQEYDRDAAVDAILAQARRVSQDASQCARTSDPLYSCLRPLRELLAWIERGRVRDRLRDYDTLEAVLLKLGRDIAPSKLRKGRGAYGAGIDREQLYAQAQGLLESIAQFREASGASLACELQSEMSGLVAEYESLKKATGKLDFLDLLLITRDLLRRDRAVRDYFQQRFTHIFVDEFQDTDPLQAAILLLLSADNSAETEWLNVTPVAGKLFVVGDPKQSIYKFRRADVVLYGRICSALESRGVGRIFLTQSHRAVRPIQQFVNAAFAPEMTGDTGCGQAVYTPMDETGPRNEAQPSVVVLPVPRPYGESRIAKKNINECLPDTITAFVEWLIYQSGWKVRKDGKWIDLRARHICILFRRFVNFGEDLTRSYVRGLDARGIPHLLVGSKSFHHREEVEAIRIALTAIEWPEDELAVFAVLRGSLFALPDDLLLRFKHQHKRLHPFRSLPEDIAPELKPVSAALRFLADLHRDRSRRAIADTINILLEHVRAHAGFALRPSGQQVLANVLRICDLARAYEMTGGFSFRGFVDELNAQAEKTESAEAPVLEEASDGVRLMTVHNAKGLESPVVILADMTANLSSAEPDRFVDPESGICATRLLRNCSPRELLEHADQESARERAEGVRVCYVAATRARDLLVIPGVGDGPQEGWLGPLNKAIYPERRSERKPELCSYLEFSGDRTVLSRPFPPSGPEDESIRPGLHKPQAGAHRVLWWDPSALRLEVEQDHGLHNVDVLKAGHKTEANLAAYRDWRDRRARMIEAGRAPEFDIAQVTDIEEEPPEYQVSFTSTGIRSRAAGGLAFGTLVHTVLRDVPAGASNDQIEALARMHARVITAAGAAAEADIQAAIESIEAVIRHPVWREAAASSRMHRELPVTMRSNGTRLLEGVLDLAYKEPEGWVVVDYKTDGDLDLNREVYVRQLRWYMHALFSATGEPARGVLFQV
jgi:ATP-dependent helicase/nuclease subunit A